MELIVIVFVAVALLWSLGLFKPVTQVANMATREMSYLERDHKNGLIDRTAKLSVDSSKVETAKNNAALIDSYDDL
jgi:hypothetical protein